MASKSTNPRSSRDSEAVKTFEIDVDAGRPLHGNDEVGLHVPTRTHRLHSRHDEPTHATTAAPFPEVFETEKSPREPIAARRFVRQSSWWVTSLALHVLLLSFLAASTFVVMRDEPLELNATPATYEVIEELQDLEIESVETLDTLEDELASELQEAIPDLSEEPFHETPLPQEIPLVESAAAEMPDGIAELGNLFGENGTGLEGVGSGAAEGKQPTMATFFGTEVKARRILYMLDNSGGMRKGGKFEALVRELQASVDALNPKQRFYIVFYSDTVYPLFFPRSVRKFVAPNDRNRNMLAAWLDSVELCGGNAIDEALAAAEVIRPEVVFLLTDGDLFTTEKKRALLLNAAGRRYKIHTFGLGVGENTKTAAGLKQVAEANGGTFRAVSISRELKELAQDKQRPYHSKEPGPVWGIKVGQW